jgi:hypothetical protein
MAHLPLQRRRSESNCDRNQSSLAYVNIIEHGSMRVEGKAIGNVRAIPIPCTFKLIEYAIVLIEIAQLSSQMIVDRDRPYRSALHVDVPDFEG